MGRSPKKHLPSFVTILNLFAGFLSVIHSLSGDFTTAAWLIVIAGIMDIIDGKIARIFKTSSEFGIELDSLADISSFGFAPSILIYKIFFYQWGIIGILVSFLPLAFGSIRLARFNAEATESETKASYFKGLPIPAAAFALATFVLFEQSVYNTYQHRVFLVVLTALVSLLMISRVRYDSMPNFTLKRKEDVLKLIVLLAIIPIIVISPSKALFPLILGFVAIGLLRAFIRLFRSNAHDEQDVAIVE